MVQKVSKIITHTALFNGKVYLLRQKSCGAFEVLGTDVACKVCEAAIQLAVMRAELAASTGSLTTPLSEGMN